MDLKQAKEFSYDAIYEISQMVTLIKDQTEEIEYLKDKLLEATTFIKETNENKIYIKK
ncbi:hypothetical protein LGK95_02320 [Clostridium algoriphilum]|uniref:hypothetical protein n=1 Tax=Clostridium algoriphilum TaxID=198347 RepID=UPI001CF56F2E|nr:hypothetical protein [Clostridium algoriphilum]MCB2292374.1 hypothetical protein [Clostridium algoriphilum]